MRDHPQPELAPVLAGIRVTVRPLKESDLEWEYRWMTDRELQRWIEFDFPVDYTKDHIRAIFDGALRGEACILIIEDSEGVPVGDVWLHPINRRHGFAEVVIQLGDRERWGEGLAREALSLVLQHAFGALGLHRVEAQVLRANRRAIRLFKTAGFKIEGTRRQRIKRAGGYMDVVIMAILANEAK